MKSADKNHSDAINKEAGRRARLFLTFTRQFLPAYMSH